MHLSPEQQRAVLDLARGAIRAALAGDRFEPPPSVDAGLRQSAGCFVTLHETRTRRLRGCVGRLEATTSLAETSVAMGRAVLEDPRFVIDPVKLEELGELDIEVSLLSPLAPAAHPLDFDLLTDGIYLTYEGRSGCFLPQVARETGWGKEKLLDRLCVEKMGLPAVAWRHPATQLFRFTVLEIGPEPFEAGNAAH